VTALHRVRCIWNGGAGLPGISTFYFRVSIAGSDITALKTFFTSVGTKIPSAISITVPQVGDTIEDSTGALTGDWAAGTLGTISGSGGTGYAAGTGCAVTWETGVIVGKHRLRGRTYLAPLQNASYDTDGTLTASVVTAVQNAGTALVAACPTISVWHRPKSGSGGSSSVMTAASVADFVRSIRSRRS
jgi:hypothetical protein